jgi:hypothetical protein
MKTWIFTSTPPYALMAECLVKHRDSFTFYLAHYPMGTNVSFPGCKTAEAGM